MSNARESRVSTLIGLIALIALIVPPAVDGGTFVAQVPTYRESLSTTSILVIVDGKAVYVGDPDFNDNNAFITTTAYASNGDPQGNAGRGRTVNGPFSNNYELLCTDAQNGCPGRIYIALSPCTQFQYFYRGRTGVEIYHQFDPEIDTRFGPSKPVPCKDLHPRIEPCESLVNSFVLPVTGGPQLAHALPENTVRSLRTEIHGATKFIMDEWAVLAVDAGADGRVSSVEALAASSGTYAAFRRDGLVEGIEIMRESADSGRWELLGKGRLDSYFRPGRSILLAVDEPVHPHNERWIEKPLPRLLPGPVAGPADGAIAVVRAEYGEDRSLLGLDVLYAERPLTGSEQSFLESHLTLEYASDASHRAVLFAVVSLGKTVTLELGKAVLPECCCEIDPETGTCIEPGPI